MPLTPKLTTLIPPQQFELIRNRIGEIASAEFGGQYALDNSYPRLAGDTVWVERCVLFNGETELPAINVNTAKGDYSNQTLKKADGKYWYNLDVYANASSSEENGPGDQRAMVIMLKMLGMLRSIFSAPVYRTLGYDPGTIGLVTVERFFIADKSTLPDALNSVVGRLQISVEAIEVAQLQTSVPLQINGTTVMLEESEFGYFLRYNVPE